MAEGHIRHMNVVGFTGKDWWVYRFCPRAWAAGFLSRELWDVGRRSFTLPDGDSWEIVSRGVVKRCAKPEGL